MSREFLMALRERVRRIEQPATAAHGVSPFGIAAIDRAVPGGGLAQGALHEILGTGGDEEDGALAAAFAAGILGRLTAKTDGIVLWCLPRPDLYGPGLAAHGLDPGRLVLVGMRRDAEILWVMEEGLRAASIAAVVGEIGTLPMVASRRLQLAAEHSGVTAFLLRRWRDGGEAVHERNLPNAAATRWRISALPSQPISTGFDTLVLPLPRGGEGRDEGVAPAARHRGAHTARARPERRRSIRRRSDGRGYARRRSCGCRRHPRAAPATDQRRHDRETNRATAASADRALRPAVRARPRSHGSRGCASLPPPRCGETLITRFR